MKSNYNSELTSAATPKEPGWRRGKEGVTVQGLFVCIMSFHNITAASFVCLFRYQIPTNLTNKINVLHAAKMKISPYMYCIQFRLTLNVNNQLVIIPTPCEIYRYELHELMLYLYATLQMFLSLHGQDVVVGLGEFSG